MKQAGLAPLRATDTRLMLIERRLSEVTADGEQRLTILREAMAHFAARELAERDERIATLKRQVAELTQKLDQKKPSISKSRKSSNASTPKPRRVIPQSAAPKVSEENAERVASEGQWDRADQKATQPIQL